MKKLGVCVLATCLFISSSCATMLKGTSEEITVVSDPSGAMVSANEGSLQGVTPVAFDVPSKQDLNFTVTKQGYLPQDLPDPTSFRWGYETWSFIEFVLPMCVDLADGAAWGHDHMTVTAHLEPNTQVPAAAAAAPSPFKEPPVASAESAPVTVPAPGVHPESVAAAPVPAPAAVPSAAAMTQPSTGSAPVSAITQQPASNVPAMGPVSTTPE